MRTVQTVTGPCAPDALGTTLMHEHLLVGWPGWEAYAAGKAKTISGIATPDDSTVVWRPQSFPPHWVGTTVRWDVEPSLLELEITENTILTDPIRARAVLTRLSEIGVSLAIDDFGSGHSSLGYLKRLPVDVLKIDRSFVMGMGSDENDAIIVRSTIDLGHHLGLSVVAEGPEQPSAVQRLRELGCDMAQGYCISRPIPVDEFRAWVH